MAHIIKDFFVGSVILVVLALAALLGFVLFFILNIFFHIFSALAVVFLAVFLFFSAIWLIGFLYRHMKQTGAKKSTFTVIALILLFVFFPVFCSHGGEHIVLYRLGAKDPVAWEQLRKYLGTRGYATSMYDGTNSIEKHVENVNKLNKLKASAFLAMDFGVGEKNQVMVAVTTATRGKGNILAIEEMPALYANESRELASSVASAFDKGVKEFPLFPLLGVDMPGIYLRITCTPDKTGEVFQKLHEGIRKYFKRGIQDER